MRNGWWVTGVFSLGLVQACGAEDARGDLRWDGTMETLASGVVVVSNPADGVWDEGDVWRLDEVLRLGVLEGDGPELFGDLVAVEVDEQGRLFVLDRQAREVRVFEEDGQFVRVIGGPGEGPGELADPIGLGWGEDGELWVVDQRRGRYLAFDTAGDFRRQDERPSDLFAPYWRGRIEADGTFWEFAWVDVEGGAQQQAMVRVGQSPDTVWIPRYEPDEFVVERDGAVFARRTVPFSPQLVWHLSDADRIWWGVSDSYRFVQGRPGGDTVRIVEREFESVPVTAADEEAVLSSQLYEQFERFGGTIDRSRIPPAKPAFERILEDDRGFVWVWPATAREDRGHHLDVFDPQGRYMGRVVSPEAISPDIVDPPPVVRGDRFVAIVSDELDVPQVWVAQLNGRQ